MEPAANELALDVKPSPAEIAPTNGAPLQSDAPPPPRAAPPPAETEPLIDPTREPVEIVLDHPIEFDGRRYERLVLDLVGLRRRQWKAIRKTFHGIDSAFNPFPLDDEDYQAVVAAEAAQVPLLLFDALDPRDWLRVSGAVFQFLGKSLDPRLTRPKH